MEKRTKIVCTLGPAVDSESTLANLIQSGMDIARLNFGHGSHAEHLARINRLKKVRRELDSPCAILLDTCGPEIRTGVLAGNQPVRLQAGKRIVLTERPVQGTARLVQQSRAGLSTYVKPGTSILLDEGLIELAVDTVDGTDIVCTVQNTGMLGNHKTVNLPGTPVDMPALTEKDEADLRFGIENGVDFVASSVRTADDARQVRAFLDSNGGLDVALIAKIETAAGVDNIEQIEPLCDAVLIARGDLGVEIDASKIPHIQKRIIELCNDRRTPVVIANQMLDSMMRNPRPTRAEAADVANAVYDGADALMLSGETAQGKYPVPAVVMMANIVRASEPYVATRTDVTHDYETDALRTAPVVGQAAVQTAQALHARCIVTATSSGRTARLISNLRPQAPIYAVTQRERVMRRMQILWGVVPMLAQIENRTMKESVEIARAAVVSRGLVSPGDLTVFTAGDTSTSPCVTAGDVPGIESAPTNVLYVVQIGPEAEAGEGPGAAGAASAVPDGTTTPADAASGTAASAPATGSAGPAPREGKEA